jgi:hypothetical protein
MVLKERVLNLEDKEDRNLMPARLTCYKILQAKAIKGNQSQHVRAFGEPKDNTILED